MSEREDEQAAPGAWASRGLFDVLFTTDAMRRIFSDQGRLQGLLDFEAALARAEARIGVIPPSAAAAIATQCRAELFDMARLADAAGLAGNLAIPAVKELTALVAGVDPAAARFVHWGATSQDAMDSGLVLQVRDALDAVEVDLDGLSAALAGLAATHRRTPMAGRTWLQQALPITFGLKAAGWLSAVERHRTRLCELRPRVLVVQFGGAAGTLAALGDQGLQVAAALAEELRLAVPDLPWHAHRDRLGEVATTLGLLAGTLGKLARDVSLMMQTEVGEACEPAAPGRGGSSTMPQKRNPVGCAVALAAATRVPALVAVMLAAMGQEHERGLGGWQAEWETLPEICLLTGGALRRVAEVAEGLEPDTARMRENLDASGGLILAEAVSMALARQIGRSSAHELVEQAAHRAIAQRRHLRDVLADDAQAQQYLTSDDLDRLCDPLRYIGAAEQLVQRALALRSGDHGAGAPLYAKRENDDG